MNRAVQSLLGVPRILDGIPVAGRTDWSIFRDAFDKIGRTLDDELFARLREAHVANLREEILERGIFATRQLAKRQITWLRSMPHRVVVLADGPDALNQVLSAAAANLH